MWTKFVEMIQKGHLLRSYLFIHISAMIKGDRGKKSFIYDPSDLLKHHKKSVLYKERSSSIIPPKLSLSVKSVQGFNQTYCIATTKMQMLLAIYLQVLVVV